MTPTPLMIALDRRLKKWRKRDESDAGYGVAAVYGINHIRQGLGEKEEVRSALLALVDLGRVQREVFTSGILWKAAPRDTIDVRGKR
jgi:hypothetical protein